MFLGKKEAENDASEDMQSAAFAVDDIRDIMMQAGIFTVEKHAQKRMGVFEIGDSPEMGGSQTKRLRPPVAPTNHSLNYGQTPTPEARFNR